MSESHEHLQTLTEIRSLMERSSKFLSLSGLSGISAGIVALVGAGAAYTRLQNNNLTLLSYERMSRLNGPARQEMVNFLLLDAAIVLVAALLFGIFFTVRKARRQGHGVWNSISKRLLWALAIPLVTGGIFCLALVRFNLIWLTFPSTLIFYGMALYSGSKYTVRDVEYLGLSEIMLGLLALFWTGYSLLTWAVGFGVLHIVYGTVMYLKYERDELEALMREFLIGFNKAFESKARLGIMSVLIVNETLSFNSLKELLDMTDGNLATHLRALEEQSYVSVKKQFVGRKPNTTYTATPIGRQAFTDHLNALEDFIRGSA